MKDHLDDDTLCLSDVTFTRGRFLKAGVAVAAAPALLHAGGAAAAIRITPRRGGTIRIAYGGEPTETNDMFKPFTSAGWVRRRQIFEPLVEPNPETNDYRLVLAESIRPNADGSEWTIKLRRGIKWSDGSPVTADDLLYTIQTNLDPKVGSANATVFSGADPAKVVKVDGRTVRVGLKAPAVDFVETMGAQGRVLVVKDNSRGTAAETIGAGPFKLAAFTPGQSADSCATTLYRRRSGGQGPYVDGLEVVTVNSEFARINALRAGQVDYASFISPASARLNAKSTRVVLHKSERGSPYVFNMNLRVKPFDDPRVRLAFKLATNRKQLIDQAMLGYGVVGNDMYGIRQPEYPTNIPQRAYDPARARQLLQQAGATNLSINIHVFNYGISDLSQAATSVYIEQLKAIGVRAKAIDLPYAQFRANLASYLDSVQILSYLNSDLPAPQMWNYVYGSAARPTTPAGSRLRGTRSSPRLSRPST